MAQPSKKIAVIGAGPCGSVAALALNKKLYDVTLIDKQLFPRHKICGDALGIDAVHALYDFNSALFQELIQSSNVQQVNTFRVFDSNNEIFNLDFAQQKIDSFNGFYPLISRRYHLDNFLFHKAINSGARFLNAQVVSINKLPNSRFSIKFQSNELCEFDFVLLANGAQSLAKRFLNVEIEQTQYYGIRQYIQTNNLDAHAMYFFLPTNSLPVYFWAFPVADNIFNVGIYFKEKCNVVAKTIQQKSDLLAGFVTVSKLGKIFGCYTVLSKPEAYNIPFARKIHSSIIGDNFLVAGAAAGLADPLTGEGISYAIKSGLLAATTFNRLVDPKIPEYLKHFYVQALEKELGKKARQSFYLQKIFSYSWLCAIIFWLIKKMSFAKTLFARLRQIRKTLRGEF